MITKILITLLVAAAALAYMRSRNRTVTESPAARQRAREQNRNAMFVAIAFVVLTLAVSAGVFYWHWSERHQLHNVQVINSHTGERQTYQVYRDDIGERKFTTIDGRRISLSDAERMEVQIDENSNN